jgi:hypothetical protein
VFILLCTDGNAEEITYAIFRTFEEEWVWLVKQRA